MNGFEALERSLMDIIHEFEIKLGYSEQVLRLFYPEKTLMRLLECENEALEASLAAFTASGKLGGVRFQKEYEGRVCAIVPAQGIRYTHEHYDDGGFLEELIKAAQNCPGGMEDILSVFRKRGDDVACEFINNGEFDYLVYFRDSQMDAYRYCFKLHNGHAAYHRFTKEDYEDFGF